ncbi:MAG: polysaccharide deacetylase family protein [Firmicutes bacterium]|nr:polysaccharide deacetylase family protein [Bacillota bacterium]
MRFYCLRRRQIRRGGVFLALGLLAFAATIELRTLERKLHGVRPGVILEDRPVGGLLHRELVRVVEEMSFLYDRPPQDAMFFEETGEIVPEREGRAVDVAGTVEAVARAAPGTRVRLILRPVPPAVTKDYFVPLTSGSEDRPEVALTFNVAWGEESLPSILDILKAAGVRATFFFVGDWVKKFPDLTRAVAAAGHEIGNHGSYHGHPTQLGRAELVRMIQDNAALLKEVVGRPASRLFAPPYGEFDKRTVGIAAELGYRTVLWTVDTIDWKRPAPEVIADRVAQKVRNGAIVLMHPTAPTVAALPGIIKDLKARGFRLVTVGEMLR